jgi:hypothetical protein
MGAGHLGCECRRSGPPASLSFSVMRDRMLQNLDWFFRHYLGFVAALWVLWLALDLTLGLLVFPSASGGIWYIGLGGSAGCVLSLILICVVKALFHKRVIRAIESRKGSNA